MKYVEQFQHFYHWSHLAKAIILVTDEMKASKEEPGSDYWVAVEIGRKELYGRVARKWMDSVAVGRHLGDLYFPYCMDAVMRLFIGFRKLTTKDKAKVRKLVF